LNDYKDSLQTTTSQCGRLAVVTAGLWLLLAGPAWSLADAEGLEGLSYAAVICLLPGWLFFFLVSRYRVADNQGTVVLLGTAMRLLFVVAVVMIVQSMRTDLGPREFHIWIIVFYLAMLLVETLILVKQHSA